MSEVRVPGRGTLAGRLLTTYAVVFILLIGFFGLLTLDGVESVLRRQAVESLERQVRSVRIGLAQVDDAGLGRAVDEMAEVLDSRLTVIGPDGGVLADSAFEATGMENHATRPEVVEALRTGTGVESRVSDTTGVLQTYVAVNSEEGRVYRLSITEERLAAEVAEVGTRVGVAALIAGVVGILIMAVVARRVSQPIQQLTEVARQVAGGRLEMRPRRSAIRELDRLGLSIGQMASELGDRVVEAEGEREILQALLDALPQGVILIASDGTILYGNRTVRGAIGDVPERLAQLAPAGVQRLARGTLETGEPGELTVEPHGSSPALRALATPLPDGRVLLVLSDITERVRLERMRRDFVADASHELKTPIASILAASETLQMALERDPDRAPRFVGLVHESALQLARIVGDLLDLSRLETSTGGTEDVRLDRVIEDELERLRPDAAEKDIELIADLVPTVVLGSPSDLGLAVRNLVSNGIRYSNPGDRVTVRLVPGGDTVRVMVRDTGVGIPQRSLSRVFERFYRVDDARSRQTGGTGLGLAIVKHVAETHGGSVSVESELGVGSTFHLVLPLPTRVVRPDGSPGVPTG
ncbi:MAG TPA: ATP-binding protein [Acidimicrobiia bacterium]|nr:ATP-binding protein [Acidimicrobiia bacterium]